MWGDECNVSDDQTGCNYNQSYSEENESNAQLTVDYKPPSQPHRLTSPFTFDLMHSTLVVCTVLLSDEGSEPVLQVSSLPCLRTSYSKTILDLACDCKMLSQVSEKETAELRKQQTRVQT